MENSSSGAQGSARQLTGSSGSGLHPAGLAASARPGREELRAAHFLLEVLPLSFLPLSLPPPRTLEEHEGSTGQQYAPRPVLKTQGM